MINILVIFLLIINQSVKVKSDCGNCFAVKVYQISSDLKINCLKDCPYYLKLSLKSFNNTEIQDQELNVTLIGYNIGPTQSANLAVNFDLPIPWMKKNVSQTSYYCFKINDRNGHSGATVHLDDNPKFGNASFNEMNKTLTCFWSVRYSEDLYWPQNGPNKHDLMANASYKLGIEMNGTEALIDENPIKLSNYSDQYLKCCGFKTLGNNESTLYSQETEQKIDFVFKYQNITPKMVRNELSFQFGTIAFDCHFDKKIVEGSISLKGAYSPLTNDNFMFKKIVDFPLDRKLCQCSLYDKQKVSSNSSANSVSVNMSQLKSLKIIADQKIIFESVGKPTIKPPPKGTSLVKSGVSFTDSSFTSILISFIIFSILAIQ